MSIANAIEYKGGLNGLKTAIGIALIALAHAVGLLSELAQSYPQFAESLNKLIGDSQSLSHALKSILDFLGSGFLGFGFLHKLLKLASPGSAES